MKTISLKKVSAVAVASLGFGLLSVVPAQAANIPAALVTSINLTRVTSTPVIGSAVVVNFGAATAAQTVTANDTVTFTGAITAFPASGYITVAAGNAPVDGSGTKTVITAMTKSSTATGASLVDVGADATTSVGGNTITSSATAGIGRFTFTPTVAGTYTLTVFNDAGTVNGTVDLTEARQTIDITVAAAPVYSAALSTMHSITGNGTTAAVLADNSVPLLAPVTVEGTNRGAITVTLRNTANATMATGNTLSAVFTGSGGFGSTAVNADTPGADACATPVRTKTGTTDAVNTFILCSDGTSGVGTATISVTNAAGVTTVLGTKTITFYGTVTTLTATVLQAIAKPGVANGNNTTNAATQATLALTPAVVVVAKDANGVIVPGLTVTGKPADTTIIVSSVTAGPVNGTTDLNGPGYINFDLTGGAVANVGKSTTIVYSTIVSATSTISSAAVTVSLAGTPATVTWSIDKASYAPGAPVVLTVTAKDAAGNAAADGTYATLFAGASVLGGSITGSTPAASVEIKGGVKTFTAFAPGNAGTYLVSNKFGASMPAALQGGAISVSIAVADQNAAANAALTAQIDSLNAKIVALTALIAKIMKSLKIK